MNLNEYGALALKISEEHGFVHPKDIRSEQNRILMLAKLMLVVTEVAEMAEAVRKGDELNFAEEIADVLIRTMQLGSACGINMDEMVSAKCAKNDKREYLHGKVCAV